MARKREEITVRSGIMINGEFVEIKSLSAKERSEWQARQAERLSNALGDYYNTHPEELADFVKLPGVEVTPT